MILSKKIRILQLLQLSGSGMFITLFPMEFKEPGKIEVFLQNVIVYRLASPMYSGVVKELGLKGNEKVLDYGSGAGPEAKYLARALEKGGGEVHCVDISRVWMEECKKHLRRYSNVRYHRGELKSLDLEKNSFDCAVIHYMLHDLPEEERGVKVKVLAGLLKKGGKIYIKEPTKESHGMSADEIRAIMEAAGLKEESGTEKKSVFSGFFVR